MSLIRQARTLVRIWDCDFYDEALRSTPVRTTPLLTADDLGGYDDINKLIGVSPAITDVAILASVLVHEGCHALDDKLGRLDPIFHVPTENKAHELQAKFCLWYLNTQHKRFKGPGSLTIYRLARIYRTKGCINVCEDVNELYCIEDQLRMLAQHASPTAKGMLETMLDPQLARLLGHGGPFES